MPDGELPVRNSAAKIVENITMPYREPVSPAATMIKKSDVENRTTPSEGPFGTFGLRMMITPTAAKRETIRFVRTVRKIRRRLAGECSIFFYYITEVGRMPQKTCSTPANTVSQMPWLCSRTAGTGGTVLNGSTSTASHAAPDSKKMRYQYRFSVKKLA